MMAGICHEKFRQTIGLYFGAGLAFLMKVRVMVSDNLSTHVLARRAYARLRTGLAEVLRRARVRGKQKYFCIGRNKTGTTSLARAFRDLGFVVANQRTAEQLADEYYFEGRFAPILEYCRSAQVFQDIPFSCPETFRHCDRAFPGSKFILTVRDDAEQWYSSICRFHAKKFGVDGALPTADDLRMAAYVRPGFMYNYSVRLHGTPDSEPYKKDLMVAHYDAHNRAVRSYFSDRPGDLLVLNLARPEAYQQFLAFLGVQSPYESFPWENRT